MVDWKDLRIWALAVPVVLVGILAAWALSPLVGDKIVLETQGVDPPDLLRGDYMQLAYPIATMDRDDPALREAPPLRSGDIVYLVLEPGPRRDPGGAAFWEVERVTTYRPQVGDGQVCIRAEVNSAGQNTVHVTMGIEAYFVQKDQEFDAWWEADQVSVEVHVRGCEARITAVLLDGVKWDG